MKFKIITNNPMVKEKYSNDYYVEYFDVDYEGLLNKVKFYIEDGGKLLTHPLSGSVKPNETPYKSVLVTDEKKDIDIKSLKIIIDCIDSCKKFGRIRQWIPKVINDFQVVDFSLITSALESANISNV